MHEYYERGDERDRLAEGLGRVEFRRTTEIVLRHLPASPATVADVGGGPGRYAVWLGELGHRVHHSDVVPLHVEQARRATAHLDDVCSTLCDARQLDLADESVDAALLLGPLYHLPRRPDRLRALAEARRVVKPGGPIFAAAISRWAGRLHGVLVERHHHQVPELLERLPQAERDGVMPPLFRGSFNGFSHRPRQLADEIRAADLELVELVNVEGPAALLIDIDERLDDPVESAVVFDSIRAVERTPELLGVGPHLLAVARRPDPTG